MKKFAAICFMFLFVLVLSEVVSPKTAEAQLFCRLRSRCCAPCVTVCCPQPVCCMQATCRPRPRLFSRGCCDPCNSCCNPCGDSGCGTVVSDCCGGSVVEGEAQEHGDAVIESPAADVPETAPEAEDSVPEAPAAETEA